MKFDGQLLFCGDPDDSTDRTGLEVDSSPKVSTNIVDLQLARNIGGGEELSVFLTVKSALAGAGAALVVTLETSASDTSWSTVDTQTLGTIPAVSAAGTPLKAKIDPGIQNARYARLCFTESGGTITGGFVWGGIVLDVDDSDDTYYASGFTVKD